MSTPTRTFYVEIDPNELMCRMVEAASGFKRPEGKTAAEAVAMLEPRERADLERLARGAFLYLQELVKEMKPQQ